MIKFYIFIITLFVCHVTFAQTLPKPDHIVIVLEENRDYSEIVSSSLAPYINSLLTDTNTAVFTDANALVSGSQPNYLMLYSGSDQGVSGSTITSVQFTTCNLGASLIAGGYSFTSYSEDLPSVGFLGTTSGNYARKHNPSSNWQGTSTNQLAPAANMPFSAFPTHFDSLPTVSIVVPNLIDDMHTPADSTAITPGDTWLHNNLGAYIQWAKTHNSMLMFAFDESSSSTSEHILIFFIGQGVKGGYYGESLDWYRMLRTMEDMYHLPYCGNSTSATPVKSCWSTFQSGVKSNTIQENAINVWPIPARGSLNFSIKSAASDDVYVSVIDQLGRIVKKTEIKITAGENDFKMDMQDVNAGIYFIKVQGETTNSFKKAVIE